MKIKLGILIILIIFTILMGTVKAALSPEIQKDLIQERKSQITEKIDSKIKNVEELLKGKYVGDEIVVKFKGEKERFRVIKVPEGKVGEKIKEYLERGDVEYVEPNYVVYALWTPNDQYYIYQWHLDNSGYGGINMESAWDLQTGSSSVIVAVVDTGIAYENYGKYCRAADLVQTCFVAGYDFVNNDSHPNDDNRHGTHVAGTIAQSTNNSIGVAGIAFNTCLMPVKVLDQSGYGTYADVADGIYFAVDNGAQVINLSLGGSQPSETLENAVAYAYNNDVTVVAAAGNDGSNSILYPAAYDDYVIAIGATRYDETLAYYSNYGSSLDLVAPGGDLNVDQNNDGYADGVLQQTFKSSRYLCTFNYYFFQGTSMATPHVAGTAALLISQGNATTPDEVRSALQETAEDLGDSGWDETYGWGLIDAYAALNYTEGPACSTSTDCDDGNACTIDTCINPGESDAYCSYSNVADGTSCNDGLFCTINDVCTAGQCGGTTRDCSDGVTCTIDSCDENNDTCTNTPNNSYCDNGLYCDGAEICNATSGCQAGIPIDCNDNNECTLDSCNEESDNCKHTNVEDNTSCSSGGGVCCSGECLLGETECPTGILCWSGSNGYLYRNNNQARKFCKCSQGTYGYSSYSYSWGQKTVYKYLDSGNNENWAVSSLSSNLPVYKVKCPDGIEYLTNQDYYY